MSGSLPPDSAFGLDEFGPEWDSCDEFVAAAKAHPAVQQFVQMCLPNNHVEHNDDDLDGYLEEVAVASVETIIAVLP